MEGDAAVMFAHTPSSSSAKKAASGDLWLLQMTGGAVILHQNVLNIQSIASSMDTLSNARKPAGGKREQIAVQWQMPFAMPVMHVHISVMPWT